MQLSEHFDSREFQCPCCGLFVENHHLVDALEQLRALLGVPLIITSGTRCRAHNAAVGGKPDSEHLHGRAVDVIAEGISAAHVQGAAKCIPAFINGGIGSYRSFTHLDVRLTGAARW